MKTQSLFSLKKNQTQFPTSSIKSSKDAYNVISQYYGDDIDVFESFFLLLLNTSNNTIGYAKISQGGIAGTIVDVKIIAKYCIDSLCSGVVLAHNHPSGNCNPSDADRKVTSRIKEALKLIDVLVLDHIILTSDDYFSFGDNHLLD